MITISFQFPAGRYHATPWGRHVNEGAVEWPPSPWRILRAIIATWKRTLPQLSRQQVEPILRAVVEPPRFVLPPASTGHTRHYMLWYKHGPDDRTLVFDTFVAVPRDARLLVCWPDAMLDETQRCRLAHILQNLNTLGRSESWCHAELFGDDEAARYLANAAGNRLSTPLDGHDVPPDAEIIRLLCPDPASAFADDCAITITKKTAGRAKKKQTVEERSTIYDPPWNMCMETLQFHKERWSDPPGSRWVRYSRPRDCFRIEPPARSSSRPNNRPRIHIVRYALDSTVLPLVTETLPVAEAARRALMSIHGRLTATNGVRGRSPTFSGKDERGDHLVGHGHAYYLPADEDGDGRLDHLTIFARDGLGDAERRAIDRLRMLRTGRESEQRHPLRVLLLGMGATGEYQPGPLGTSSVWVSATPYIATRYAKTRGRHGIDIRSPEARADFLQNDIRAQLAAVRPDLAAAYASTLSISPLCDDNHVFKVRDRWRTIQFRRSRRKTGDDGRRRLAGAFSLTFPCPVSGPIALGWSSHFGMGLFLPVPEGAR